MLTLCGLYFAQGIPWGFVTVTLLAWLAKPEHGLTTEQLGPVIAVAALPWSFKFLWGPLMDRFPGGRFSRRFGRRRPWIIFAQSMAVLVFGAIWMCDDLPSMVWTEPPSEGWFWASIYPIAPGPLLLLILVGNVFVSLQDVAVDALAVDLLAEEERGVANGLMYGCSYLGTAVGGAGLGLVVARWGIGAGLLGQCILLATIMLLPILLRERPSVFDSVTPNDDLANKPIRRSVVVDLLRAFSLRSTILGAVIALGIKIGIGVLSVVFVNYLIKDGGWTQEEYTTYVGGYSVMLGLAGAILGGFLADRFGAKFMILLTSVLLAATWIGIGVVPDAVTSKPTIKAMLLAQEFILAVSSVSLFALFMGIAWPKVAATQFTAYMALMNFSVTIGSYTASVLDQQFTISQILIIAGLSQIAMTVPVLFIDPRQTREVLGDGVSK